MSTQTSVKTGQHEPVTFDQTTPQSSQNQWDSLEGSGDQTVTPRKWQQLKHQNLLLAQQLQEREVEQKRLREQLDIHLQRQERLQKFSPPGLPSRVLDGRPVIRKETQAAGGSSSSGGREPHWDKAGSPGSRGADEVLVQSLQSQIDQLSQEKEAIQHSLEGDKMALEAEVERQREAIVKLKERKEDLTQNMAVLTFENSHQNGTISMLKEDNFMLHTSLDTSMRQVRSLEESYSAVRRENTELRAEVQRLTSDRLILTKEKDTLRKNMFLGAEAKVDARQELAERAELKEKLSKAEHEVKSLREQLERKRDGEEARERAYAVLGAKLGEVSEELTSTRELVAGMESQQKAVLRESFAALVQRFGERSKSSPQTNVSQIRAALQMANDTIKQLKKETDHLTCENALMMSQKAGLASEVQKLKAMVADLRAQRELLESQVAKGKSLLEEKEVMVARLKEEQAASHGVLATKEQEWREEMGKMGEEWKERVERVEEEREVALREQETLTLRKEGLEGQVIHLKSTNDQLTLRQEQLVQSVHTLEAKVADLVTTVAEKEGEIAAAQKTITDLRAERSRVASQLEEAESEVQRGVGLRAEFDHALRSSQAEACTLRETLVSTQAATEKLQTQVLEQTTQIEELCKKVATLTDEKARLCVESEELQRRLVAALKELQEAKEAGLAKASENERVIRELKERVASLEEEKGGLEERVAEVERAEVSAFQKVPESKQLEQLKQKIASLQQESRQGRKGTAEVKDLIRRLSEAETHIRLLETENQQLKKSVLAAKEGIEPPLGTTPSSLHRQMAEVKMKLMFAEKERDDATERVRQLLTSQKASTRDASKQQETQRENASLLSKLKATEDRCRREMVVFGDRLKRATKENDQLRHRLTTMVSSVAGSWDLSTEKAGDELKTEVRTLEGLKVTLCTSRVELARQLERNQQQMLVLERDLQSIITAPQGGRGEVSLHARRTVSATLPPVLQNLPPGVLSSFQGAVTPPRYPTPTPTDQSPLSSATEPHSKVADLHPKVAELRAHHATLAAEIQGKLAALQHGEEVVESMRGHLLSLTSTLQKVASREREVQEAVAKAKDLDLPQGQLQLVQLLEQKVTVLEDQVYDRDVALQEINQQMGEDYKKHNDKLTNLMSQIKELREQLVSCTSRLKAKDKFIQDSQAGFASLEGELWTAKKELEQLTQERDQLVSQCVTENAKVSGFLGVKEYLCTQKEELTQAQKTIGDFKFDLRQLQSQLETVQRDKSSVELKGVEMERMHIHMKEALNNEIAHLRHLNLVLVEQQLKGLEGDKVKELMTVVKETQDAQRKHKEAMELETRLDAAIVTLQEERYKNVQLEQKVYNQEFLIRIYETDKGSGRFVSGGRPRSAEVPRRGFRISQNRQTLPFAHLPEQSDFVLGVGGEYVDLQTDSKAVRKRRPCLGPAVETDDEVVFSLTEQMGETPAPARSTFKPQHRRTASDSINVLDHYSSGPPKQLVLRRPDSAGSTAESLASTPAILGTPMDNETSAPRDSISSVAQSVTQQVSALSQAIVGPEELSSQKDGSDSSSKSCSFDVTATVKQTQSNVHGHVGGTFKMPPPPARPKEARSNAESTKVLRSDSMSSSTASTVGGVSRDTSFSRYDGSESSSQSLSHESFEVGSQLFRTKEFQVICASSSDDDVRVSGRGRQRNACETPHVKECSFSSCDSDIHHTHQRQASQPAIPLHHVESISLSEMEYGTDMDISEKVEELARKQLGKPLGKVKSSSTGSIKVCYGDEESSNTSMEDVRGRK